MDDDSRRPSISPGDSVPAPFVGMERNYAIIQKCAALGEPFFVMRAQDCFACALVREWANLAESAGVPDDLVSHARMLAMQMRRWPKKKIPD